MDINGCSKQFLTIPKPYNLAQSISLMSLDQLQKNIVQVNLLALQNEHILQNLITLMKNVDFYYQNRYILPMIFNNTQKMHKVQAIQIKFDLAFINNQINDLDLSRKQSNQKDKNIRRQLIRFRQNFIKNIQDLSNNLKAKDSQETKKQVFKNHIQQLNLDLAQNKLINDTKDSLQRLQFVKIRNKNHWKSIEKIVTNNSYYINTKNRTPLVLDFQFGKYIYKNDNQVAHQVITMQLIKYLNTTLTKPLIIQYNINPQNKGAFYQFVQQSMTISKIKKQYQTLEKYINILEQKNSSEIRKRFAQSYAGFCFVQYILEIKDRNNNNIMIRKDGSIFHIDLAFILQSGPGGINFQSAPFKMTQEYLKIMKAFDSQQFKYFESLLIECFTQFHIHKDQFLYKMSILSKSKYLKCFVGFNLEKYKKKFNYNITNVEQFVQELIQQSNGSWSTKKYDKYQYDTNGILY